MGLVKWLFKYTETIRFQYRYFTVRLPCCLLIYIDFAFKGFIIHFYDDLNRMHLLNLNVFPLTLIVPFLSISVGDVVIFFIKLCELLLHQEGYIMSVIFGVSVFSCFVFFKYKVVYHTISNTRIFDYTISNLSLPFLFSVLI